MKKFFITTAIAGLTFLSCQKEAATTSQLNRASSVSSSSANGETIVTIAFTGRQFFNSCNNETMTVLSGTAILNINTASGSIRETNVHNFVEQDEDGNIYHGVYTLTATVPIGDYRWSFRLVMNQQGGGINMNNHGVFHIAFNADSTVTAFVDNFFSDCH